MEGDFDDEELRRDKSPLGWARVHKIGPYKLGSEISKKLAFVFLIVQTEFIKIRSGFTSRGYLVMLQ